MVARRHAWAAWVVALAPVHSFAQLRFHPCAPSHATMSRLATEPTEGGAMVDAPGTAGLLCAQVLWCNAQHRQVGCCEPGASFDGASCVCTAANHHDDQGHCCPSGTRWSLASESTSGLGGLVAGECCPTGTVAARSSTFQTDVGMRRGDNLACCPTGTALVGGRCSDPLPCEHVGPADSAQDGGSRDVAQRIGHGAVACEGGEGRAAGPDPDVVTRVNPSDSRELRTLLSRARRALLACWRPVSAAEPHHSGRMTFNVAPHVGHWHAARFQTTAQLTPELVGCARRSLLLAGFAALDDSSADARAWAVSVWFLRPDRSVVHHRLPDTAAPPPSRSTTPVRPHSASGIDTRGES